MPPTALKLMSQVGNPRVRYDYAMRSIGSGGEALGEDILDWCRETFGFDVNEFYGQTEANLLVGNCSSVFPIRPGSMGRAIPGHDVEIVSPQGTNLRTLDFQLVPSAASACRPSTPWRDRAQDAYHHRREPDNEPSGTGG